MIIIIKLIKIENCFSGRKSIVFHGKSDGVPDKNNRPSNQIP
jgi:hypothetical protein